MKKYAFRLCVGCVFLLSSLCFGVEIQLRLSSGLRRIYPDEINLALAAWGERIAREASTQPGWSLESGKVPSLRLGFTFEGELTLFLTRRLALGLSAGYLYGDLSEEDTLLVVREADGTYDRARPTKVSGYPVTFLGYIVFPLGSKFDIYLKGGGGFIQAKYVEREAVRREGETKFSYSTLTMAEARRSTYLGGVGFDYRFDPSFGFFVEAAMQSAQVGGFSGENEAGEMGRLYFFEEYLPQLDFWQATVRVLPEAPAGENYRSVREATVDFSGFSVKIGMLVKF
jgi:hypothetical protein